MVAEPPHASHFSCCRRTPPARRQVKNGRAINASQNTPVKTTRTTSQAGTADTAALPG